MFSQKDKNNYLGNYCNVLSDITTESTNFHNWIKKKPAASDKTCKIYTAEIKLPSNYKKLVYQCS